MKRVLVSLAFGLICLLIGLAVGICLAPQLKLNGAPVWLVSVASKIPGTKVVGAADKDGTIETYDYPTIKWRAKPLAGKEGAIVQLWTTYENSVAPAGQVSGNLKYRLTVFKAPEKQQCEVQLLDKDGFKLMQFDATDFHQMPGSADIMEARDSNQCTEDLYRRVQDYSIK